MNDIDKKSYTLILNKSFQPLGIEGVKKSLGYLIGDEGKALDPISYELFNFTQWLKKKRNEVENLSIKSEKYLVLVPEIIVLNTTSFSKSKRRGGSLSKRKVFERDKYICGYCGCKLDSANKTIDHIIPISRDGHKTSYTNVVACCFACNSTKGNRTPEEMGWKVKHRLYSPDQNMLYRIPKNKILDSWKNFL